MSFVTVSTILAAAVAPAGTFVIAYPDGRTGGDFSGGVAHQLTALQKSFSCPVDFGVAFGAASATITWRGTNTLPQGTPIRVQFDLGGLELESVVKRAERAYPMRIDLGMPVATSAVALRAAAAVGAGGALVLIAAALTLDVPRNLIITSSGNDSARTFVVAGTDEYGVAMTESITGANAGVAAGKKAFKKVVSITIDAAAAANVSVGYGNVLGFPIYVPAIGLITVELQDNVLATAGTKVAGLAVNTASTATTADVRGTYVPNTAPDGAKAYSVVALVSYRTFLGVPQA